jgi:hypothetical protein
MNKYKQHIRTADLLLQALNNLKLEKLRKIQNSLGDFSCRCMQFNKGSRLFQYAVDRCWYPSARKVQSRISRDLNDLSNFMDQFKNTINADNIKLPQPGEIVNELLQIEQEFGDIKLDLNNKTVSVITESIVLEEISFGPFEIRLFLDQIKNLATDSPYKIIALEPNPAGSDCNVTHPHVSSEKLCEGDGFMPIRTAIQQGRLSDFFTIIVQILQTYNPDSPYVSLDDWEGISCYDCGYTVAGDDCYYCEDCERDYCSSCSTYCQICDTTVCLGCSFECPGCNKPVCRHCTEVCVECDETYCKDCINEEHLCFGCQETREEQENEELEEETTISAAEPAVQPDSLGQTRISA